jgi:thiamine-phosphate pyrophosphorylase
VTARRLPPPLLALTPGVPLRAGELEARVRAAVGAGLCGVLLREPSLADGPFLELAARLRELLGEGWLGLHDRGHLAAACRADGVHLGFRSLRPVELRGWLPEEVAIGLSTHAGDDPACFESADYLFHGPVFSTPKPVPLDPVGPEGLASAVRGTTLPVWGLGGITPARVEDVLAVGARGVAVLSGLLGSPDPARAAAAFGLGA